MSHKHSPCPYHALLSFIADLVATQKRDNKDNCVKRIQCSKQNQEYEISIEFQNQWLDSRKLGSLPSMLRESVLGSPRDWRITATSAGNFHKPFIDLSSRLLGIGDGEDKWNPMPTKKMTNVAGTRKLKPILLLSNQSGNRRFMVGAEMDSSQCYKKISIRWDKTVQ